MPPEPSTNSPFEFHPEVLADFALVAHPGNLPVVRDITLPVESTQVKAKPTQRPRSPPPTPGKRAGSSRDGPGSPAGATGGDDGADSRVRKRRRRRHRGKARGHGEGSGGGSGSVTAPVSAPSAAPGSDVVTTTALAPVGPVAPHPLALPPPQQPVRQRPPSTTAGASTSATSGVAPSTVAPKTVVAGSGAQPKKGAPVSSVSAAGKSISSSSFVPVTPRSTRASVLRALQVQAQATRRRQRADGRPPRSAPQAGGATLGDFVSTKAQGSSTTTITKTTTSSSSRKTKQDPQASAQGSSTTSVASASAPPPGEAETKRFDELRVPQVAQNWRSLAEGVYSAVQSHHTAAWTPGQLRTARNHAVQREDSLVAASAELQQARSANLSVIRTMEHHLGYVAGQESLRRELSSVKSTLEDCQKQLAEAQAQLRQRPTSTEGSTPMEVDPSTNPASVLAESQAVGFVLWEAYLRLLSRVSNPGERMQVLTALGDSLGNLDWYAVLRVQRSRGTHMDLLMAADTAMSSPVGPSAMGPPVGSSSGTAPLPSGLFAFGPPGLPAFGGAATEFRSPPVVPRVPGVVESVVPPTVMAPARRPSSSVSATVTSGSAQSSVPVVTSPGSLGPLLQSSHLSTPSGQMPQGVPSRPPPPGPADGP